MSRRTSGFARQADNNHAVIVAAFKQMGVSIVDLRLKGGGCPDLLAGFRGRDRLVEIKRPGKAPNATQEAFCAAWKGAAPVVVRTVEDCAQLVRLWLS